MKDFIKCSAFLGAHYFIITLLILVMMNYVNHDYTFLISTIVVSLITISIVYFYRKEYIKFGNLSIKSTSWSFGLFALLFVLSILIYKYYYSFNLSFFEWNSENKTIPIIILNLFLAPVFEEIIFRGITTEYLLRKNKSKVSIAIFSALFFGIYHTEHIVLVILIGFILSLSYLKERNLLYPILIHSGYNFSIYFMKFI